MCGRFALAVDSKKIQEHFDIPKMLIEVSPMYNIAPQSFVPVIYEQKDIQIREMKWGLVPSWSREPKVKFSNFNARSETIQTSAAYRNSFATKRCLIPATGFYEWQVQDDGTKKPLHIHLSSNTMFSFAGLYDIWTDIEGKELWTCTILTREANDFMKLIHDRMPVILQKEAYIPWLENTTSASDKMSIIQSSKDIQLLAEDGIELLKRDLP